MVVTLRLSHFFPRIVDPNSRSTMLVRLFTSLLAISTAGFFGLNCGGGGFLGVAVGEEVAVDSEQRDVNLEAIGRFEDALEAGSQGLVVMVVGQDEGGVGTMDSTPLTNHVELYRPNDSIKGGCKVGVEEAEEKWRLIPPRPKQQRSAAAGHAKLNGATTNGGASGGGGSTVGRDSHSTFSMRIKSLDEWVELTYRHLLLAVDVAEASPEGMVTAVYSTNFAGQFDGSRVEYMPGGKRLRVNFTSLLHHDDKAKAVVERKCINVDKFYLIATARIKWWNGEGEDENDETVPPLEYDDPAGKNILRIEMGSLRLETQEFVSSSSPENGNRQITERGGGTPSLRQRFWFSSGNSTPQRQRFQSTRKNGSDHSVKANQLAVSDFEAALRCGSSGGDTATPMIKVVIGPSRSMFVGYPITDSNPPFPIANTPVSILLNDHTVEVSEHVKVSHWKHVPFGLREDGVTQVFKIPIANFHEWKMLLFRHFVFAIDASEPANEDEANAINGQHTSEVKRRYGARDVKRVQRGPIGDFDLANYRVGKAEIVSLYVEEGKDELSLIDMGFTYLMGESGAKLHYDQEERVLNVEMGPLNFYTVTPETKTMLQAMKRGSRMSMLLSREIEEIMQQQEGN